MAYLICLEVLQLVLLTLVTCWIQLSSGFRSAAEAAPHKQLHAMEWSSIIMDDGVKLAVTYHYPEDFQKNDSGRWPVILEALPYRKDDSFYAHRYDIWHGWTGHGFVGAQVDIRGTGGSEGQRPWREYSWSERDDLAQVVQHLAKQPWSDGAVGMYGLSWSAFNAIMMAMQQTRGDVRLAPLKAILVLHGSDDLYLTDLHYMDGIKHYDEYILSMDHENSMPLTSITNNRSKDYPLNSLVYLKDRFGLPNNASDPAMKPWTATYLEHPTLEDNGSGWWKNLSYRYNPGSINTPSYLIAGLSDGYRDFALRMYEDLSRRGVPAKLAVAPKQHDFPDRGTGPFWNWQKDGAAWFHYWLGTSPSPSLPAQASSIYVRQAFAPGMEAVGTPGSWRSIAWPAGQPQKHKMWLAGGSKLVGSKPSGKDAGELQQKYNATVGTETGVWWGDKDLPDMINLDKYSLLFDQPVTGHRPLELIGFVDVQLRIKYSVPAGQLHVRLEDVFLNGSTTLVTGASLNAAHIQGGPAAPQLLVPGKYYTAKMRLHFTTYTFPVGHRIRIAVTNSLFRMFWPVPKLHTTTIAVNHPDSWVALPLQPAPAIPPPHPYNTPYTPPEVLYPADGFDFIDGDTVTGTRWLSPTQMAYDYMTHYYVMAHGWASATLTKHTSIADEANPANAAWLAYDRLSYKYYGNASSQAAWTALNATGPSYFTPPRQQPTRTWIIQTWLNVTSNATHMHVSLERQLQDQDNSTVSVAPDGKVSILPSTRPWLLPKPRVWKHTSTHPRVFF